MQINNAKEIKYSNKFNNFKKVQSVNWIKLLGLIDNDLKLEMNNINFICLKTIKFINELRT